MKKLLIAFFLFFMVLAFGAMTGADLFCGTASAAVSQAQPDNSGPDGTDDGTGGSGGGPDDTDDGGGCGGGGSGGGSDPDGSGGGGDF